MLTRTGEYALRALVHLTRNEKDWPIPGRRIAEETEIPAKYLSTLLSDLVRAKVLTSARGKSGGFRMAQPAKKPFSLISLSQLSRSWRRIDRVRSLTGSAARMIRAWDTKLGRKSAKDTTDF